MRVPIEKVPIDVRRRAWRALESLTAGGPDARRRRELAGATIGTEATPIYRPDLDEVAYWEFEVEGVKAVLETREGEAKPTDRGFVVVATGGHDVPIPHFSLDAAPPSRQLEALYGAVERVVKLDALAYAAEDSRGSLLGHIGTMPPKLEGVPAELPKKLPQGWATAGVPDAGARTEDGDQTTSAKVRQSREQRPIKVGQWRSWTELKGGYAASYQLHLAALAERATHPWAVEKLTDSYGEGIRSGQTHTVRLLQPGDYKLTGPGAEFVSAALDSNVSPPRLSLTPKAGVDVKDTTFQVEFHYGRTSEVLTYFIVPEGAPTTVVPEPSPLGPVFER